MQHVLRSREHKCDQHQCEAIRSDNGQPASHKIEKQEIEDGGLENSYTQCIVANKLHCSGVEVRYERHPFHDRAMQVRRIQEEGWTHRGQTGLCHGLRSRPEANAAAGIGLRILLGPCEEKWAELAHDVVADLGEALALVRARFRPEVP